MYNKLFIPIIAALSFFLNPIGLTQAAELKIVPDDGIILNPTNLNKNYYDSVIHSIVIAAEQNEDFILHSIEVSFLQGGTPFLTKTISAERIIGESQEIVEMIEMGLGTLLNAQVLNTGGLSSLFERDIALAVSSNLTSNQALLTGRHHFSLDFVADEAIVTATLVMPNGTTTTISKSVPVQIYKSSIYYSSPLEGVWLKTADASVHGHHRLNPGTEYAVDFFKLNDNGQVHNGDNAVAENYFGYGAPVMAAADGEVVFLISDDVQDRLIMRPKEGKNLDDERRRISRLRFQKMVKDFSRSAAGNIVVLRHELDGHVEYSSYGHLAANSVSVQLGDTINRGDVLGAVGDTGDSLTVHLHFQVN